jgi:excinuclease ABC subunit B
MNFQVVSDYQPKGDQPQAIEKLTQGIIDGEQFQTLLELLVLVKPFTVAIYRVQRPTLVLAHNKTLAAQLYSEFKQFFQNNAVFCFLLRLLSTRSMPVTGVFIEDLSINEELEKMRMSTTASLLSGRRDILVVASVSCCTRYWKSCRISEKFNSN